MHRDNYKKTLIDQAQKYIQMGLEICPAEPATPGDKSTGKKPVVWSSSKGTWVNRWDMGDYVITANEVETEFDHEPLPNIHIICGKHSRRIILDFDAPGIYEKWAVQHPDAALSVTVRRDNEPVDGRCHVHFNAASEDLIPDHIRAKGWELRSQGDKTCAPPSIHYTGGQYHFVSGPDGNDRPLMDWQDNFLEGLPGYEKAECMPPVATDTAIVTATPPPPVAKANNCVLGDAMSDVQIAREALTHIKSERGQDYHFWVELGLACKTVSAELLSAWDEWSKGAAKYEPGKCAEVWESMKPRGQIGIASIIKWAQDDGWDYKDFLRGQGDQLGLDDSDVANADRLVEECKNQFRYDLDNRSLWVWNAAAGKWIKDPDGVAMMRVARGVYDKVRADVKAVLAKADKEKRKGLRYLADYAKKCGNAKSIRDAISLAKGAPDIQIKSSAFDADPYQLNCKNGILDLRNPDINQNLMPHVPEKFMARLCDVNYDAAATCPLFEHAIEAILCGDSDLIRTVQRIFGYTLTGSTSEQVVFIFLGDGGNGKSLLLNVLRSLLGEYAGSLQSGSLVQKDPGFEGISNDIAGLAGKRFVASVEINKGFLLDESRIKLLTGEDACTARFLHNEYFEFVPFFKLFLACNRFPNIPFNNATDRRIVVIPFEATFSEETKDKNLLTKLRPELPGILNWALKGCHDWQREGNLSITTKMRDLKREQWLNQNTVLSFIEHFCRIDSQLTTPKSQLYMAYREWCRDNCCIAETAIAMSKTLKAQGITDRNHGGDKGHYWLGIGSKTSYDLGPEIGSVI